MRQCQVSLGGLAHAEEHGSPPRSTSLLKKKTQLVQLLNGRERVFLKYKVVSKQKKKIQPPFLNEARLEEVWGELLVDQYGTTGEERSLTLSIQQYSSGTHATTTIRAFLSDASSRFFGGRQINII